MFIPKKPDAAAARRELMDNLKYFAAAIVVIRGSTYLLDALQHLA